MLPSLSSSYHQRQNSIESARSPVLEKLREKLDGGIGFSADRTGVGIRECVCILSIAKIQACKVFFHDKIQSASRTKIDGSIYSNLIASRPFAGSSCRQRDHDLARSVH